METTIIISKLNIMSIMKFGILTIGFGYMLFLIFLACIFLTSYLVKLITRRTIRLSSMKNKWAIILCNFDPISIAIIKYFYRRGINIYIISDNNCKYEQFKNFKFDIYFGAKNKILLYFINDYKLFDNLLQSINKLEDIMYFIVNYSAYHMTEIVMDFNNCLKSDKMIMTNFSNKLKIIARLSKFAITKFEQDKRGILLLFSSLTSIQPCPYLSLNSSYNCFIDYLGRSLYVENKYKKITILTVKPIILPKYENNIKFLLPDEMSYVKNIIKQACYSERSTAYCLYNIIWWVSWQFRNWNKVLLVELNTKFVKIILGSVER